MHTIRLSPRRYELALRVLHNAWQEGDSSLYEAYLQALLIGLAAAA
jgi:hypothetical protein